ncbi:MAG: TatD family hydrolase [Pelolinea sp.]|nr:TatD family hydrolase [Pelolinea sp.]
MPFLSDTHCHLYMQDFDNDIEEVVNEAYAGGVRKILIPGIDLETSHQSIILSEKYPECLYAAIGIHPNYSAGVDQFAIETLESLVDHPKVVAIGEIGLDFYREKVSVEVQIAVLQKMLDISKKSGKPICIHNRNSDAEIISLLDDWYTDLLCSQSSLAAHPGVFHSFSGSEIISKWALAHNFYLGISGPATFLKSQELQKIIAEIDIAHLIIETDAPFLCPHPYRGKRNEPQYVRFIAEKIAEIKKMELSEVITKTSENANNLFDWEGV